MLYRNTLVLVAFFYAFIITFGCSGGGTPPTAPLTDVNIPGDTSVPDGQRDGTVNPSKHMSWGIYEIHLDMINWTSEVTLKREAQWHANVTAFMLPPFCPDNDCLVIDNFGPWEEPFTAQFDGILKHPFPDPNLDGFDVRGIGIFKANTDFPSAGAAYDVILNPDGYTKLWNDSQFVTGSDLNPFRAFWTKNDADEHKRRFEGGKSDTQKYIVRFPESGQFAFDLAIDASYEFPELVNPEDPTTSPNSWEPFEISGYLTDDLLDTPSHEVTFDVFLFDWQNNPSTVTIEAPDLFDGTIDLGAPINQVDFRYDYQVSLVNEKGAAEGPHPVLLTTVDGLNGQDPFGIELIMYNIFTVNVKHYAGPLPPVAVAEADKEFAYTDEIVTFDASASYDPDGEISTYAWDLDFDGYYDDAFEVTACYSWDTAGEHCVNVMVTDLDGLTDTLDEGEEVCVWINEIPNDPPIAIAKAFNDITHTSIGGYVKFLGEDSYDPDGTIIEYNWDFDGDFSWGDSLDMNPTHQFNEGGEFWIWLKVTDNNFAEGISKVPLYMEVSGENIPPVAEAEVSCDIPVPNKQVIFTSTSYDPDGFIMKWEWDFDDGLGWIDYTTTEGYALHGYPDTGTYYVRLRVTDSSMVEGILDPPLEIVVGDTGFEPPSPFDCSGAVGAHIYQTDMKLGPEVDHTMTYDICGDPDGNWVLGSGGRLYKIDSWGTIVDNNFHTLQGFGPMLLSIDYDEVNYNYAYVYGSPYFATQVEVIDENGISITTINVGSSPQAVCFDWAGNLWILDSFWEIKIYLANKDFEEDPCVGYLLDPLDGRVFDMAVNFRNHALYIFSEGDDGLGQLVRINHDGTLGALCDPVFDPNVGPSSYGDIIIDNSDPDGISDCRIEVFAGDSTGAVARFDSELNLSEAKRYLFWGNKAACLLPGLNGLVITLETCCWRYFDRYIATTDW